MNNDNVDAIDAILDIPRPPDINDRQWAFIHAVSRPESTGKSAAIEAGYSVESAESKASQLLAIGKIRQAVDSLQRQYQKRAVAQTLAHQERYSRDWVLSQFEKNAQLGRETSQLSASNRAIELIGKAVHPGMLDRGDGSNVQVLGDLSFTMNIGSASGDDTDDLDVIEGSSVPILDEPDE